MNLFWLAIFRGAHFRLVLHREGCKQLSGVNSRFVVFMGKLRGIIDGGMAIQSFFRDYNSDVQNKVRVPRTK